MKARELIAFLERHPDKDVEVCTESMICPVNGAQIDCFDSEQGHVVLLTVSLEDDG